MAKAACAHSCRCQGSNTAAQVSLTVGGLGVSLLPTLLVQDLLDAHALVRVCPDLRGPDTPIFVMYPSRRLQPARARAFIDRLVAKFE